MRDVVCGCYVGGVKSCLLANREAQRRKHRDAAMLELHLTVKANAAL